MYSKNISLKNPERFTKAVEPYPTLIDGAIELAANKLLNNLDRLKEFSPPETINFIYEKRENNEWTSGMNTGVFYLAYELSGNKSFLDAAHTQLKTYRKRLSEKTGLLNHDVGFVFTPSCVADYKVTGDTNSKEMALEAAEMLASYFTEEGGFIKRIAGNNAPCCRTLVDTMMNIPLLMWAGRETGNDEYTKKAIRHYKTTEKYLVREDGSTYHHYQFNPETMLPEGGLTLQGYSDESCWSRGHSWLVYGYPIAYGYTKDESIFDVHRAVTYYFLNNLSADNIPYWDFVFSSPSTQPRDSSAAAVAVCGLLEMCKYLSDDNPDRLIFKGAADIMMTALIKKCSNTDDTKDGLITHVTHGVPQGRGIDESAIYGDYFYLEALLRYKNPDWKMYW